MTKNKNVQKEIGMWKFVDGYAMRILLCLSSRPKTRAEISAELKSIPIASVYRKIKELEKFGIIRKVTPTSSNKKYRKRYNDLYELTSEKFELTDDQGKSIHIMI